MTTNEKHIQEIHDAQERHGFVCNNTVNWGDCWGETMCGASNYRHGMSRFEMANVEKCDLHSDYQCTECGLDICGCCYHRCPICNYDPDTWDGKPKGEHECEWCGAFKRKPLIACYMCDTEICKQCAVFPTDGMEPGRRVACPSCVFLN